MKRDVGRLDPRTQDLSGAGDADVELEGAEERDGSAHAAAHFTFSVDAGEYKVFEIVSCHGRGGYAQATQDKARQSLWREGAA
jgi:hypothetical protein